MEYARNTRYTARDANVNRLPRATYGNDGINMRRRIHKVR